MLSCIWGIDCPNAVDEKIINKITKSCFILNNFAYAKLRIIRELSKEYFKVIDFEDAAVADFATFAGGKYLDVAPTSVKIVSQGDTVTEFEDRAVGFPYGNIDWVAAVEHRASGGYVYRASHQE